MYFPNGKSTINQDPKDACGIHGILGVHVDDGLGGGDALFAKAIDQLEARFPFGSRSFAFTGIQVNQDSNGDIRLNKTECIKDISGI